MPPCSSNQASTCGGEDRDHQHSGEGGVRHGDDGTVGHVWFDHDIIISLLWFENIQALESLYVHLRVSHGEKYCIK